MLNRITPQSLQEWVISITALVGLITGTLTGGYKVAKEVGWIDSIEKGNTILAQEHVGEKAVEFNTVIEKENDIMTVAVFKNGDAVVKREWDDDNGRSHRSHRWFPKREWDAIVDTSISLTDTAYASDKQVPKKAPKAKEVYVGQSPSGYSVYAKEYLGIRLKCIMVDEATGEIIEEVVAPCEQYIVKPTE